MSGSSLCTRVQGYKGYYKQPPFKLADNVRLFTKSLCGWELDRNPTVSSYDVKYADMQYQTNMKTQGRNLN